MPEVRRQPTREQQAVIDYRGGHLRLLAPPGTGKTDTIAGRIGSLLAESSVSPDLILALSFSRLAAAELNERIVKLRGPDDNPRVRTLHAFALELLRENRLQSVCGNIILDDWEMSNFFRQDIADRMGGSGAAAARLLKAMEADWRMLNPEQVPMPSDRAALEDSLHALRKVFDFALLGELIPRLLRWAITQPAFAPSAKHFLVDEYQDLNRAEQALINLLVERSGAELLVAGDDDQSIYGWRQADMTGIREFVSTHSAVDFSLQECWRCGQEIIDCAWAVISQVPDRPTNRVRPVSKRDFPGKVTMVAARSAQSSPKDVANLVAKLIFSEGATTHSGEILILVSRKTQAGSYETSLKEANIPVSNLAESGKTMNKPSIRELFYILRSKLDPSDPIAIRALLALKGGIGSARIKPIINEVIANRGTFVELTRTSTDFRIREVISKLDAIPEPDWNSPGIQAILDLAEELGISADDREELKVLIEGIIGSEELTLKDLIITMREFQVAPQANPDALLDGPVRIMTMRQAKGLSAPVVICTDLDDDIVPGSDDLELIQEQRRLLYVSMTRAIHSLYLFYCGTRSRSSTRFAGTGASRQPWEQRRISRFLDGSQIEAKTINQLLESI